MRLRQSDDVLLVEPDDPEELIAVAEDGAEAMDEMRPRMVLTPEEARNIEAMENREDLADALKTLRKYEEQGLDAFVRRDGHDSNTDTTSMNAWAGGWKFR